MEANVAGRVANTKLAVSNALAPLYEAIFNSVDAVSEVLVSSPEIRIFVLREPSQQSLALKTNHLPEITGFRISDNGVGFDDAHFTSFDTLDSPAKSNTGGKGIGRIFWLKAFEYAEVSSVFVHGGKRYQRKFNFRNTTKGVEDESTEEVPSNTPLGTTVHLKNFLPRYREGAPKNTGTIARKIVEHCLELFAMPADNTPRIVVEDLVDGTSFDLQAIYHDDFKADSQVRKFRVAEIEYEILDVLVRRASASEHSLTFCAHRRAVKGISLTARLPILNVPIRTSDGDEVSYFGYVSGRYLDEHVDSSRLDFDINRKGELPFESSDADWEDIESAALEMAEEYLQPQLVEMRKASLDRVTEFVKKEPRYRVLLGKRAEMLSQIPSNLSESQLEAELHKVLHEWKLDVKRNAQEQLEAVAESADYKDHKDAFNEAVAELQDAAKSELAEYVVHRATVLRFFERLLGKTETGKFPTEDALHNVIFPLHQTSNDVDYDDHNLWILDERLVYHHYLASDVAFKQQVGAPIVIDSDDRPDLIIYDRPFAYSPSAAVGGPPPAIVIFEFKRPERRDVGDEKSPIAQVLRYVSRIRDGRTRRDDDSTIEPVPKHTPFYCYVVATLTEKLRQDALERSFTEMPDGQGYFHYNQNHHAYIEVLSYRKVLGDAKKRNKVFFDKLGLPER
jgi:hypothetical protein